MFQRPDHEGERERFWRKTEEEIGETVRAYALTRCMSGCIPGDQPLWGILFFTESSLFFRHFEQRNWFSALTSAMSSERREPTEVYFSVPRAHITVAEMEQQGTRLSRIFAYRPPVLRLVHAGGSGPAEEMRFTLDTNPKVIATELGL